jgi:Protein of unknown function (DUF2778)
MRMLAAGVAALSIGIYIKSSGTRGIEPGDGPPRATFDVRFFFGQQGDSFEARFAGERISDSENTHSERRASDGIPPSSKAEDEEASIDPPTVYYATRVALAPWPGGSNEEPYGTDALRDSGPLADIDSHTAIYDIIAHTVYLPSGRRLEAHSGLGSRLDDPRFVSARGRGPTPPNAYHLTLRESLFHGVRALRLVPVGDSDMFGRDGILAHSYMLGPSGQSNGCVAFSNYPAFLEAFLSGEVDRLVVVDHLATAPSRTASGRPSEPRKDLFRGS